MPFLRMHHSDAENLNAFAMDVGAQHYNFTETTFEPIDLVTYDFSDYLTPATFDGNIPETALFSLPAGTVNAFVYGGSAPGERDTPIGYGVSVNGTGATDPMVYTPNLPRVEAKDVPEDQTHVINDNTSETVITVNAGFQGTLKLVPDSNQNVTISEVTSLALTGPASVTGRNLRITPDFQSALGDVPALTVTGTYTATWTIVTTAGATVPLTGLVIVQ